MEWIEQFLSIFSHLKALFFLFLIPLFWGLFRYGNYQRKKALARFASPHLIQMLTESVDEQKRSQKRILLYIALLFLVLTLLRPRWGYTWVEVQQKGIDIMIVLDVSRSMLADDIKPDRLERAKREIKDLLAVLTQQGGDRIGLVIFSGRAFVQCPLTFDYGVFNLFLDQISTESIQKGGTAIVHALHTANDAFKSKLKQYKAIILITDGDENQIPVDNSNPQKAQEEIRKHLKDTAKFLREEGVRLFTIGIGSEKGSYIPVVQKQKSGKIEKSLLKDRTGNHVRTKMDIVALQMMALETGGVFYGTSGGGFLLEELYEKHIRKMKEKELSEERVKRKEERFQFALLLAICLLFFEPLISEKKQAVGREKRVVSWIWGIVLFLFLGGSIFLFQIFLTRYAW